MNRIQKIIKMCAIILGILIIVSIFSALIFGLSFFGVFNFSSNNGKSFENVYKNINNIDIEVSSSSIKFENGNEFKIVGSNVSNNFKVKNNNSTLKIEEKKINFINKNTTGEITIYVPDNSTLNNLKIESGAGKIYIKNIKSNMIDIDQGTGLLTIDNSIFLKGEIDGGAGNIEITSSTLNNLDMDAGVGSINIESYITGKSNIECGIGTMDIKLLGNIEEYRIDIEKGLGIININGEKQESSTVYGNGTNLLELSGGVGNINVEFN